jgi:aminomethyltransferase
MSASDLRRTPLDAQHRALSAKMGAFAGWLMPIEYRGTLAEHTAVREGVGVFDVSHLGRLEVRGPDALEALQRALTNDLARVETGAAQYGMALNDEAGIVDDLIAYRIGEAEYLVVPNASNTEKVRRQILSHAGAAEVLARDDLAIIAPQGPRSFDVVDRIFPGAGGLGYLRCRRDRWEGHPVVVSRSGYTGERGFELFVPVDAAAGVWSALMNAGETFGIQACGLAARDTLRLEMGYPLHGNDISEERTPLEAGLMWAVSLDKGEFRGREALLRRREAGAPSHLWGLRMKDRPIPRPHYPVLAGGERVGETTSGTFSPTLKIGIALAYLEPADRFSEGDEVEVDVRGRPGRAEVVRPPVVGSSPRS